MNKNKYNIKRAKILLKGSIPSFIGIFLPKNKKRIIFNSTRNEFYNFNTKYLFEYFIKYYPEYECKYVMNDNKKREILNQEYGEHNHYFIETESLKGMFYALRAKIWVTSAFETPVGGLFLNLNRFIYLLGHGTHFKAIVFNEKNLSYLKNIYYHMMRYNFSKYLVTSSALLDIYAKAYKCSKNRLIVAGEPRHDKIYTPEMKIIENEYGSKVFREKNVLYAPTWRPNDKLELFPFNDIDWYKFSQYLEKNKINIYLRMHPSFQENLVFYTQKSNRIKILDNTIVEDISDILDFFDLLITDYSSIYISYLLLEKPVMFIPYDFEKYNNEMGFIQEYDSLTPGPKVSTMKSFQEELIYLLENKIYYENKRKHSSNYFNQYQYNNCKMNAEFILNI